MNNRNILKNSVLNFEKVLQVHMSERLKFSVLIVSDELIIINSVDFIRGVKNLL